jgi:MoxR-like ATPase
MNGIKLEALRRNMNHAILGCEDKIELLMVALLAQGHVLIQGSPGMGKTSLAKTMAHSVNCIFKRVQFTPDLLPADILGYSIYNQNDGKFHFHQGPVFCNVLLADEINRTTPRIQSALLESMNEEQVSIDGQTRKLEPPFFVIATENVYQNIGTYPLLESQLDRFLLSFEMERPDIDTQANILKLHWEEGEPSNAAEPVINKEEIISYQEEVQKVAITDDLMKYIARLAEATHQNKDFASGISSRGVLALMHCSQAYAWLYSREFVYPDDIKKMLPYVFVHRLALKNRFANAGKRIINYIKKILDEVPVP